MRFGLALALAGLVFLSGCALPTVSDDPPVAQAPVEPSCPTDALRRQVYADAEAFGNDRLGVDVAGTIRLEGTMEGEIGTFVFALAPAAKSLRFSIPGTEVRVVEPFFSIESTGDEPVAVYGRDHRPGSTFDEFLEEFGGEDEASFTDDLTVDDYVATCVERGGVAAIEYRYERDGRRDVNVAERTGAHRPLSGEIVDPALQDNYRISVSYDVPTVTVDASLERMPSTWGFGIIDSYTNARGGLYLSGKLDDATTWAPLHELEVHLVDEAGTVYVSEPLASKLYDMGDGDLFRYTDQDANGKFSQDDTFFMDVGPGLDIAIFDAWAMAYVLVEV